MGISLSTSQTFSCTFLCDTKSCVYPTMQSQIDQAVVLPASTFTYLNLAWPTGS